MDKRFARPLSILSLAGALLFGSAPAQAVTTAYCQEAYIDGCLNSVHCTFWNDGVYSGSVHVNYRCPV